MAFYLAFLNVVRNSKNSLIIILLIAAIIFIFFAGNSVIERSNISMHNSFINSLTGDVVIQKKGDISMNLFGANTPVIDEFFVIPSLPLYDEIIKIAGGESGIKGITSQVSGKAFLDMQNVRDSVLLCGVDADTYFSMFPGFILREGKFLRNGETGAMISLERAQRIQRHSGVYPQIGSPMLLTSGGNFGFKIREVPLVGIFSYQNPGLFMNEIVIIDPQTVRVLNSIQAAVSQEINIGSDAVMLLDSDIDDIFNFDTQSRTVFDEGFSADYLHTWFADNRIDDNAGELTGGDWNFIIISLEKSQNANAFISNINRMIEPLGAVAVDWRTSAGISPILLLLVQVLFNAGMFLVCIAGILTVINVLLISVFRRTREIGTLRAIGASDIYIGSLVFLENIALSVMAGIAGIFAGYLFIDWINSQSLKITNELIASMLGGAVLSLVFIPHVALQSLLLSVVLGIVVSIYPLHVTLKIQPIQAVRHG